MTRTTLAAVALLAAGCGQISGTGFGWIGGRGEDRDPSTRTVHLRWRHRLASVTREAFVPVERAQAALDPANDRIYVGSSAGELVAMTATGGTIYSYDAGGGIAAEPALDPRRDELFLATEDGVVHRLTASSGEVGWRQEIGGAVSQTPVLTDDAIYLVTDNDIVVALDREDGEPLWRYRREAPEGFYVSEHAGLTIVDGHLLTGFTAGVVVSLDPADGALRWERDTSLELEAGPDGPPRFADVDTTPVVLDGVVYIASFTGGLYALDLESGSVVWRDEELTGVTGITRATSRLLLLSSGDLGMVCIDREDREILWRRQLPQGSPGRSVVAGDLVLFGESQGGFVTLDLGSGRELGRFESQHGFSAAPSVADGRGFILGNGGTLFAFALPGAS
ncbi:MAG: PQQ-binding-like beta-propeller repeat protein [Myxococcales bacterium]|nr:PQQ-binding-like beta-propeller repeat protein [Myxococcales bacterium]